MKQNGIKTIVFISPIIPQITDFKRIIDATEDIADEYWFDKLNLRSSFKTKMLRFMNEEYPIYNSIYKDIYTDKNSIYFDNISKEIDNYCLKNNITYKNFSAGT